MEYKELVKHHAQLIKDQNQNKWEVIEISDLEEICEAYHQAKLKLCCYQIDFGNHLRCKIKVTDNGIEVEGAINGWGDGVPLDEVVVVEVQ